jgi:hypothetical protein
MAIGRTIQGLAAHGSLLEKPFLWYGKAFLRITHAVSRRQEFAADALAARTVGPLPLIEGLKLIHGAALAFNRYWGNEVAPVLSYGFHPPLVEGFRHYMASSRVTKAVAANLAHELTHGKTDPYDTHPPLRERITALQACSDHNMPGDDLPAITLLGKIDGLETQLISLPSHGSTAQAFQAVAWEDVGGKVWAPAWEALIGKYATALAGNTPRTLPQLSQNLEAFSYRLRECDGADLTSEERDQHASAMLGIALATALSRNGWQIKVAPGEDAICERQGVMIIPFEIVQKLASGELTPEAWDVFCDSAGIADLELGDNGPAGPDPTEDR